MHFNAETNKKKSQINSTNMILLFSVQLVNSIFFLG